MIGLNYNHAQAYESTVDSYNVYWSDIYSYEGNYWSDLIWDEFAIYVIDGSSNNDLYPLENPVSI